MIRTLFIIGWTVLVTGFFCIITIIASFLDNQGNKPHKLAGVWARSILFASRIKVTVTGLSNIDPRRSYIFMSNHQSNFDIPVLLAYFNVQFRWLAKAELFKIPLFGLAMQRAGHISIDRFTRDSAIESLEKAAATIIKDKGSVFIFPEGTRSRDGKIGPFKKGGFVLAVDSGVPIVPVIIHGTWRIMSKQGMRIKSGNVVLEIRKPVETTHYTRKTKEDLMEKVRQIVCSAFEKEKQGEALC
ncbi:MAG: hypothetical protein AUJ48_00880 [Deltaproteobacteria bacterium CG1_02_45_11]|nr:MAG: hypothetical protein AUJ48_00880 [Deltaproteobacteria bacterium CG1_02_45_11]